VAGRPRKIAVKAAKTLAALARELSATMTAAMAGVAVAADPLDEIRARRDRKRSAGR